jgi:hypothetical protein
MKGKKMKTPEQLVQDFLARGGAVKRCRPGTPKDLYGLKFRGLFGGRRSYVAGVQYRSECSKGELFGRGSLVARPSTIKKSS